MTHLIGYSYAPGGLDTNGLLMSVGPTVSWSVFGSFDYKGSVRQACRNWADVCDLEFCEVSDPGTSINAGVVGQQRMFLGPIDGSSGQNTVANATFPGTLPFSGNILYDSDSGDINFLSSSYMLSVTVHEMGHSAMAMQHNTFAGSVMNGIGTATPSSYDSSVAAAKYGAAKTFAQKAGVHSLIGEIYSAYMGTYNQAPDNNGLFFWYRQIASQSQSFLTLCNALVGSGSSSSAFVSNLYQRVLGRTGSQAEIDAWLATGKSKAETLDGFARSVEAGNYRANQFSSGLWFS